MMTPEKKNGFWVVQGITYNEYPNTARMLGMKDTDMNALYPFSTKAKAVQAIARQQAKNEGPQEQKHATWYKTVTQHGRRLPVAVQVTVLAVVGDTALIRRGGKNHVVNASKVKVIEA